MTCQASWYIEIVNMVFVSIDLSGGVLVRRKKWRAFGSKTSPSGRSLSVKILPGSFLAFDITTTHTHTRAHKHTPTPIQRCPTSHRHKHGLVNRTSTLK